MPFEKGNTLGKRFTSQNAREMQQRCAEAKNRKRARAEWFEDYADLALQLASLTPDHFEKRFAHPATKAEEILLWQFSDPAKAYSTLKDFQEQTIGKPMQRTENDVRVTELPEGVMTKEEAKSFLAQLNK